MIEPSIVTSPVKEFFFVKVKGKGCRVISSIVRHDLYGAAFFLQSSLMWQEQPQKTYQNTLGNLKGYKGKNWGAKWIRNVQK
jgi:hypothetical protein